MPDQIIKAVREAVSSNTPLNIVGGNSKHFYANSSTNSNRSEQSDQILNTSGYQGIVSYEPTELVVTARCGTCISDLQSLLNEQQQMLPFEPPHFVDSATVGGMVACGLSGPRRPYAGSVRDYVLGLRCINGKGEDLSFGGQVMKNVAGFDVSRLMTGALGTLGVILEVSFKLLPKPEAEITLQLDVDQAHAITLMNHWAGKPVPLSAACYDQGMGQNMDKGRLLLRLSGFESALRSAHKKIGGEKLSDQDNYWHDLNEHKHPFFAGDKPLWRIAVPPATAPLALDGEALIDWGGAQRWLRSDQSAAEIRTYISQRRGHATLFRSPQNNRNNNRVETFTPLSPALFTIHKRLKHAFDPRGIFNPGRMYPDL